MAEKFEENHGELDPYGTGKPEMQRIKWTCTYCNERNVSEWSVVLEKPAEPENCKRCGTRRVRMWAGQK